MALDINDVVSGLRNSMSVSMPDMDTSVGTPVRKMIDAFAESIAELDVDKYLMSYSYDIDSKIGGDLDAFVQLFGMGRIAATRSSGTVTFVRAGTDTSTPVFIPAAVQLSTAATPPVLVQTITSAVIPVGATSVSIPSQAVVAGAASNVAAGGFTTAVTPLSGIAATNNLMAFTGGRAAETDDELRARWKSTVFRNLAGTEQMFQGVALNDVDCTSVRVVGDSTPVYRQVQLVSSADGSRLEAQILNTNIKYIYPESVFFGPDLEAGNIFLRGLDYDIDLTQDPPVIYSLQGTGWQYPTDDYDEDGNPILGYANGQFFDLRFNYVPDASRNDPIDGVSNKIDIFVAGSRPTPAVQSVVFRDSLKFTSDDPASPFYYLKWLNTSGSAPKPGNIFLPLAYGPILSLPQTLSVNAKTYSQVGAGDGVIVDFPNAYRIVYDDSTTGHSIRSLLGIEWDASLTVEGRIPVNGTVFTVGSTGEDSDNTGYTYNEVPNAVQSAIDDWRLVGTDVLVHDAKMIPIRFSFAIVYDLGSTPSDVNANIQLALVTYLQRLGLNATVEMSDVLRIVADIAGVDQVRFLTYYDWNAAGAVVLDPNIYRNVAIQQMQGTTTKVKQAYVTSSNQPDNAEFAENEVPTFHSIYISPRASNTFFRPIS